MQKLFINRARLVHFITLTTLTNAAHAQFVKNIYSFFPFSRVRVDFFPIFI